MPDVLGIYGAVLASLLGLIKLSEFLEGRKRIHFAVSNSILVTGNPARQSTLNMISIHVGNRAPWPIHLSTIGFTKHDGMGLVFNQIAELQYNQQLLNWTSPPSRYFEPATDSKDRG